VLDAARRAVAARGAPEDAVDFESGMLLFDRPALARAGVNADSLARVLVANLSKVPGVMRVYRREELATLAPRDRIARRWIHATPDDLPAVAFVTMRPHYYYAQVHYATHGTPHDYDSHVPIVFYGAPFRPGKYPAFARTVDIAPTLAEVLGIPPTEPIDGVPLGAALRTPAAVPVRKR